MPDNITNLHAFNDDQWIIHFMDNADILKDNTIEEDYHDRVQQEASNEMKGNTMQKGVVFLERLYDLQYHFRGPTNKKTQISKLEPEQVKLGIPQDPKYVNLGTCCSPQEGQGFIHLFKQYHDAFAWTYDDLKTYDTCIIQHLIPIK